MAEIDLSMWMGNPQGRPKIAEVNGPGSDEDDEVEGEITPIHIAQSHSSSSESLSHADSDTGSERDDKKGSLEDGSPPSDYQRQPDNDLHIQLPDIPQEYSYEHLPGYFTVDKVLREISQGRYLVKLKSGEIDLLDRSRLGEFLNLSTAIERFLSTSMESSTRRKTRKPMATDFVDWSTVDLQDVEDVGPRRTSQRLSSYAGRDADIWANIQAEYQVSGSGDELDSDDPPPFGRRSLRLTSRRGKLSTEQTGYSDSSEDSAIIPIVKGKRGRPPMDSKRGKFKSHPRSRIRRDSSAHVPEGTRRSDRARAQPRRNMRERHEDEISAYSEDEVGPKIVATKEYFEPLSINDRFRVRHRERCDTCDIAGDSGQKGPLVFCQGCTSSYHKACLGNRGSRDHLVTKVDPAQFVLQCRSCLGIAQSKDRNAPHRGSCSGCRELGPASTPFRERLTTGEEQMRREEHGGIDPITVVDPRLINSVSNVMFRCANCQRAWHMRHLPRRDHLQHDNDQAGDEGLAEEDLADLRFDIYSRNWTCKDCIEHNSQIDALVAWRPADLDTYVPGSDLGMIEETEKEYLIKWKTQSYFRTTWMPGAWLCGVAAPAMRAAFAKKTENHLPKMTTEDAIPEDWLRVDIIFDVIYTSVVSNRTKEIDFARAKEVDSAYVKYKGLGYEDAIWEKPPSYEDKDRWEDFKSAYDDWVLKHYVHTPSQKTLRRHLQTVRSKDFDKYLEKKSQPSSMTGGELMDYQLLGMNWLYYQWYKNQNCVLADEMGLGKTIQVIAYLALMVQDHKCWPFLIVVPNSTCPNWRREIKKWAPSLRVVTYYGSSVARKLAQDYELFPKEDDEKEGKKSGPHDRSQPKDLRAHVVITSYESVVEEKARLNLQKVAWAGLVVDEGQRLKNEKNLLYENLSKMKLPYKILLTGTPLQNTARELFNLLQFLDPKISAAEMDVEYATLTKENVPKLHDLIRPFFLRRTKAQVLSFLPPVAQIILPVTMSVVQKKLYKSILAKQPQLMKSIFSRNKLVAQKERVNLNNILMQLRKTLCHPFVYNRNIEERTQQFAMSHRNLVEASSKLQLLQLMLPKLQERGHRVLLFSQFLENLDIVEDFLDGLGMQHRRLDGGVNSLEKQKRIDEYNAPESPYFAFLLSTRSGGIGINLATADTVIIMDPDFNPHQDIQALSRVHRIGQKNKVLVFQMMTRGSAEEKIMQNGKKKMALDHVLIQQMDQDEDAGFETESILRHGAEALFKDDNTSDIVYDSASVDKLLDRSQMESTSTGEDQSAESQFGFARVWANDRALLEDTLHESTASSPAPDTTVWDKILEERERDYAAEVAARAQTFGRGKRKRNTVDYQGKDGADTEVNPSPEKVRNAGSDTDFQSQGHDSDAHDEDSAAEGEKYVGPDEVALLVPAASPQQPTIKARPFKRAKVPTGYPPYGHGQYTSEFAPTGSLPPEHHCVACGARHAMGWCPLKLAGVEHCGLCGIAHIGSGRTCPHLNSEDQVATMIGTLKESTESRTLKEGASRYLRMIRGDLVQRRRKAEEKQQLLQRHQQQVRVPEQMSYAESDARFPWIKIVDPGTDTGTGYEILMPTPPSHSHPS